MRNDYLPYKPTTKTQQSVADILKKISESDPEIADLNLEKKQLFKFPADQLVKALSNNSNIIKLNLGENYDENYRANFAGIIPHLINHPTLSFLDLGANHMSDDDIKAIAELIRLNNVIKVIVLDGCIDINDKAIMAISRSLRENTQLEILNILDTTFTETGALALIESLTHNRSLIALKTIDPSIDDSFPDDLLELLDINEPLFSNQLNVSLQTNDQIRNLLKRNNSYSAGQREFFANLKKALLNHLKHCEHSVRDVTLPASDNILKITEHTVNIITNPTIIAQIAKIFSVSKQDDSLPIESFDKEIRYKILKKTLEIEITGSDFPLTKNESDVAIEFLIDFFKAKKEQLLGARKLKASSQLVQPDLKAMSL